MLQKIFVLILTFCMAEAKLRLWPPLEELSIPEQGEIAKKTYEFPVYAFLNPVWDVEGPKESFLKCYEQHKNGYPDVFDPFSTKILGAMNTLNRRLPTWFGRKRAENVRKRTEHIPILLKKYVEEFKKKVQEKISSGIETLTKKYEKDIGEELTDLYTELKTFEKGAVHAFHRKAFTDCYKEFQDGINAALKKCKEIVKNIKNCMEKENGKLTVTDD